MTATSHPGLPAHLDRIEDAARIPAIWRAEVRALAETETERFLELVESLEPDDWARPTACTLWNVGQILAHQAGAYAGWASGREFRRQMSVRPARGQLMEDALSTRQVADRTGRTPAELMAELRAAVPRAIANRQRVPGPLRLLGLPHPVAGVLRLGHLLDVTYTRDTWMHRLDISRATGRPMRLTREHDGRIVALVVRDLARPLAAKLGGRSVVFELAGPAGGAWRIGAAPTPAATVRMDALDFNILASGRFSYEEGRARATLEGDQSLGELALREGKVLY
jgi:uncharacterized protein (TIGR03083 family)